MRIGIDVIGEMRNTIKTFADRYCFVDEIVQNAERAGASSVTLVECTSDKIVIKNDGKVLEDFSTLFTKSMSGWAAQGNKVAAAYAFGAGFFSVMVVANIVEVRSGRRGARWNVGLMLEKGISDCIEEFDISETVRGLEVKLFELKDVNVKDVRERWKEATLYFGEEGKKRRFSGLVTDRDPRFCKRVDIPGMCEGIVWAEAYGEVETWYENRKVDRSCHAGSGIGGKFFVTAGGKLSPRAPDRKQWIVDAAYGEWSTKLREAGDGLLEKVACDGPDALVEALTWPIRCRVKDLAKKLSFVTLEEYEMEKVSREIPKAAEREEESREEVVYKLAADAGLSVVRRDVVVEDSVVPSRQPSASAGRRTGRKLKDIKGTQFAWIKVEELDKKAAEVSDLRANGITVIVAKNELQVDALSVEYDQVGVTVGILKRGARLSRRGRFNALEDRLGEMLDGLAKRLGCVPIEICDIDGWTVHKSGRGVKVAKEFIGLHYKTPEGDEVIAVSRKALEGFDVGGGALRALVYVSDVIAEEVAHSRGIADGDSGLDGEKVRIMRVILDTIVDFTVDNGGR